MHPFPPLPRNSRNLFRRHTVHPRFLFRTSTIVQPQMQRLATVSRIAGALLLLGPSMACALERYEGLAYGKRDGALVYRETHWLYDDHGKSARLVVYRCPNGTPFARKRVWAAAPTSRAPDFEFIDARDGYREGVRSQGGRREVYWQDSSQATPRQRTIQMNTSSVVDAGFDALVRARWNALASGQPVAAAFLLPSRLDFLDVSVRQRAAPPAPTTDPHESQVHLRMKLDAWYGFAAPQTDLDYLVRDRWLLRFQGLGTIRDAQGRHQEVRIEFPPKLLVRAANRAELESALNIPLQRTCKS
ncbi:hypothetical protein ACFQZQ_00545 [Lysobacter koreensis]|uniref:DUF3108 domain-containing protein n=1 Tax=Lysobacter koreensis TaxID=266122 RepID=A0ABW2YLS3_9GAMM